MRPRQKEFFGVVSSFPSFYAAFDIVRTFQIYLRFSFASLSGASYFSCMDRFDSSKIWALSDWLNYSRPSLRVAYTFFVGVRGSADRVHDSPECCSLTGTRQGTKYKCAGYVCT